MRKKKIGFDSIVSFITALSSFLPIVAATLYVESAKAAGSYGSGSGHDVGILLAIFVTMGLLAYYVLMIILSLVNDFCNTNEKTFKTFAIIITVLDVLAVLGTIGLLVLFIFFPNL